jgi:hypothetical protein
MRAWGTRLNDAVLGTTGDGKGGALIVLLIIFLISSFRSCAVRPFDYVVVNLMSLCKRVSLGYHLQ